MDELTRAVYTRAPRRVMVLLHALLLIGCAATSSPTEPSSSPRVRLSGRIVSNPAGQVVVGATVTLDGRTTTTGEDGVFTFVGVVPQASARVAISAPAHLDRGMTIGLRETRDLTIDLISTAPPFSLHAFREMARDGFEQPGNLKALALWSRSPRFFVRTVHEDTGSPIPHEVVAGIRDMIVQSVPDLTGGRLSATVDEGTTPPSGTDARGVVVVRFVLAVSAGPQFAGQATVGEGNPAQVWLRFNPASPNLGPGCPDVVRIMQHEIVHTMGFWHVSNPATVLSPFEPFGGSTCSGLRHGPARMHMAVAYSRTTGNRDVDEDPASALYLEAGEARMPAAGSVACLADGAR